MQFLTADTRGQLGFGEIWSRIKPVSALGRSLHRQAEAFLPAQKVSWLRNGRDWRSSPPFYGKTPRLVWD